MLLVEGTGIARAVQSGVGCQSTHRDCASLRGTLFCIREWFVTPSGEQLLGNWSVSFLVKPPSIVFVFNLCSYGVESAEAFSQPHPFRRQKKYRCFCVPFLCPLAWFLNGCLAIIGMYSRLFCHSPVSGILFLSIPKRDEQLFKPLPLWRSG